jgi:hypothetical protein
MSGSPGTETPPGAATEGRRLALVVAVTDYVDAALRRLRAPAGDAAELRDLLADPDIGGFSVTSVINEKAQQIRLAIEDFLADRRPDDVLLVYLSCHGLMDARRRLYFAARDTLKNRLASSGVESHWLFDQLEDCRARRQIVILDCCFSGAFAQGSKGDDDIGIGERLVGEGRGRVVLTASRGSEYSFEGEPLQGEEDPRGSVFTSALIGGIRTGRADTDGDGNISVDDAYTYAFEQVRESGTQQTPQRWLYGAEGSILLAHTPPVVAPTAAPEPEPPPEPQPPAAAPPPPPVVTGPPAPEPAGTPPGRRPRRRTVLLGIGGAAVLGAAVLAGILIGGNGDGSGSTTDGGGTGSAGATSGTFTMQAPWRLRIKNDIAGVSGGVNNGCNVRVTKPDVGYMRDWDDYYGTATTYQMRESGTFHYEVNDRGCQLFFLNGDGGEVPLPFPLSSADGDSPVFQSPGAVNVKIGDRHGTSTCELQLRSDADGHRLNIETAEETETSVRLESNGPRLVFIDATSCDYTVAAAR